jgi:hypothetical protein
MRALRRSTRRGLWAGLASAALAAAALVPLAGTPVMAAPAALSAKSGHIGLRPRSAPRQASLTGSANSTAPASPEPATAAAPGVVTTSIGNGLMGTTIAVQPAADPTRGMSPDGAVTTNTPVASACAISSTSTTASCGGSTLQVGWNGTTTDRALFEVSNLTTVFPADAHIVGASLDLTSDGITPTGSSGTLQAYAATRQWSNPTWANASTGTPWTTAGGDFDTTTAAYQAPGYSNAV